MDDIYAEHGHRSSYDFWVMASPVDDSFTDEDFAAVEKAAGEWSESNGIPCQLARTAKGFRADLVHLCLSGEGIASSLFFHLAKGVFRSLDKSFAYGPHRDPIYEQE